MIEPLMFEEPGQIPRGFSIEDLPVRPLEQHVLMVSPEHFDVVYAINSHMRDVDGQLRRVDRPLAAEQWRNLRDLYQQSGLKVDVIPGSSGLPDMVFAANQSFPFVDQNGRQSCLLSRMSHPERQPEVAYFRQYYLNRGVHLVDLEGVGPDDSWEGMGDILWVPGRRMLLIGYGFRTTHLAARRIARLLNVTTCFLELRQPGFYHLDTAITLADEQTIFWHPQAFTSTGRELLTRLFSRRLAADVGEAETGLACNSHVFSDRRVLVEARNVCAARTFQDAGFRVDLVDLSEYAKSGGSVFCMKMMLP